METLEKRDAHLTRKINAQAAEAREKLKAKDKRGAMMALRRKKLYEAEVAKLDGAKFNLEQQIASLEGAAVNIDIFQAMRSAQQAQAQARGNVDVDTVEDLMVDIEEEKAIHDEISGAISRPLDDGLDEDDLEAELAALEAEDLQDDLLDVSAVAAAPAAAAAPAPAQGLNLPAGPTSAVQVEGDADDETLAELRALEASMLA